MACPPTGSGDASAIAGEAVERWLPMCILPPMCLFCNHYNHTGNHEDRDCTAFVEIPDPIFRGEFDHRNAFPGDAGVRFELDQALADEFAEVTALKRMILESQ
jgi:hypothetical protein